MGLLSAMTYITVTPMLPLRHPEHPLKRLHHWYWSPWKGEYHQHQGYAIQEPSYTGLDTSLKWGIITSPGSNYAENSPLAIVTEAHQKSNSSTAWKNLLVPMVYPSWELWWLVSHHQPCCLLLRKHPQGPSQE